MTLFLFPSTKYPYSVVQHLSGFDLLRVKGVSRDSRRRVVELLQDTNFWKSHGLRECTPNESHVQRVFWLVRRRAPCRTILDLPSWISPLSWAMMRVLKLVPQDIGSEDPQTVAERAASLGDEVLCMKALKFQGECVTRSNKRKCMDGAIRGGNLRVAKRLAIHSPDLVEELQSRQGANSSREEEGSDRLYRLSNALSYAAMQGETRLISTLVLDEDCPIDNHDSLDLTALHYAAWHGHVDAITLLVFLGSSIDGTDYTKQTALHKAARSGKTEAIAELVALGCSIDQTDCEGQTALHKAARSGHKDATSKLLDLNCPIDQTDRGGETALHVAAWHGHIDVITELVNRGANIHAVDNGGRKVLHLAAWQGHVGAIKLLVNFGCSVDVVDRDNGMTPLHWAATDGHIEAVTELIALHYNLHQADNFGETALHKAAKHGNTEVIRKLLELGCLIDAPNIHGETALHHAARNGHASAIKTLVELECSVEVTDTLGRTALDYASTHKQIECYELLSSFGCSTGALHKWV